MLYQNMYKVGFLRKRNKMTKYRDENKKMQCSLLSSFGYLISCFLAGEWIIN